MSPVAAQPWVPWSPGSSLPRCTNRKKGADGGTSPAEADLPLHRNRRAQRSPATGQPCRRSGFSVMIGDAFPENADDRYDPVFEKGREAGTPGLALCRGRELTME